MLLQEDTAIVGRRVGGEAAVAYILGNLAVVDRVEGDFDRAGELLQESLARFQRLADVQGEAFALGALGNLARSSGDFERGRELLDRSLALRPMSPKTTPNAPTTSAACAGLRALALRMSAVLLTGRAGRYTDRATTVCSRYERRSSIDSFDACADER